MRYSPRIALILALEKPAMRRFALVFTTVLFLSGAAAFSSHRALFSDAELQQDEQTPQSAAPLNNSAGTFQFAIVSDRTGGHRAKVFSQAVDNSICCSRSSSSPSAT